MGAFDKYTSFDSSLAGPPTLGPKSKYSGYDPTPLKALDPRNAPAAPAVASQGAFAPPTSGAPMPAFAKGDQGKGGGEARRPEKNQFFDMWSKGSTEDQDEVATQQENVFAQQGLSLDGATKMLFDQGGEVAAQLGAKYGLVPPADKAGMPAFKTQEQALEDMEGKANDLKRRTEKRRAMGGFLMEMGLRILASNRDDAAGAIGEGTLGTIDARRQRQFEDEDRDIMKSELERKRGREDAADSRSKESLEDQKKRTQIMRDREDRMALEGGQPDAGRQPFSFEVRRDMYLEAFLPENATKKQKKETLQDFLKWEKGSEMKESQKENIISNYIKEINDGPRSGRPEGWKDWNLEKRRQYVMRAIPGLSEEAKPEEWEDTLDLGLPAPTSAP